MTQLTDKTFAVKVPEGANGFLIQAGRLLYYDGTPCPDNTRGICLPPGSYTFLFCTSKVTEEQARKVVAWIEIAGKIGYYDYMNPQPYRYFDNYVDSLRSLLKAKGCDGEWVVVEKI
jgi:hypothetical protein